MLKQLIIILALATLMGCGKASIKYDPIPSGAVVLAFGDSVTYGYGVKKGQDYPSKLAGITGWQVVNAGVSGERADQAKNRIDKVLEQYKPRLVIIEIGGNDFLQRRDSKLVKEDIRAIINSVKKTEATVVLIAVPSLSALAVVASRPSDSPIYQELANEEKVVLISSVFSNILRDKALHIDHIHPNERGYQQLAEGIVEHLSKVGML